MSAETLKKQALLNAAEKGDLKEITELLKTKADLETQNENGDTPLLLAVQEGHEAVVDFLLSHGANIRAENKKKQTVMDLAIALYNKKRAPDFSDSNDWIKKSLSMIRVLFSHGFIITDVHHLVFHNERTNSHFSFFSILKDVFFYAHTDKTFKKMVQYFRESRQRRWLDSLENTIAYLGTAVSARDISKRFEDESYEGNSPLHLAIKKRKKKLAFLLLKAGANVLLPNNSGDTPLQLGSISSDTYFKPLLGFFHALQLAQAAQKSNEIKIRDEHLAMACQMAVSLSQKLNNFKPKTQETILWYLADFLAPVDSEIRPLAPRDPLRAYEVLSEMKPTAALFKKAQLRLYYLLTGHLKSQASTPAADSKSNSESAKTETKLNAEHSVLSLDEEESPCTSSHTALEYQLRHLILADMKDHPEFLPNLYSHLAEYVYGSQKNKHELLLEGSQGKTIYEKLKGLKIEDNADATLEMLKMYRCLVNLDPQNALLPKSTAEARPNKPPVLLLFTSNAQTAIDTSARKTALKSAGHSQTANGCP